MGLLAAMGAAGLAKDMIAARFATLLPKDVAFQSDVVARFTKTAQLISQLVTSDPAWWRGHGTGTASPYIFHLADTSRTVFESFPAEVLYQAGLFGVVAHIALFLAVVAVCQQILRTSASPEGQIWARIFASYLLLEMAEIVVVGSESLVYFPANMLFWFVLGALLAIRDWRPHTNDSGSSMPQARVRRFVDLRLTPNSAF